MHMSQKIELPDAVHAALEEVARASGTTAADWIAAQLAPLDQANGAHSRPKDDWLDHDFLKIYAHEADESVSLEVVRRALAKIPGRLADDIRAERDER
jgi:hypothetical protein